MDNVGIVTIFKPAQKIKSRYDDYRMERNEQRLCGSIVDAVINSDVFDNSFEDSLPMTFVHKLISDHFAINHDDGLIRKAIIIGYDGCRIEQIIRQVSCGKDSAVKTVRDQGGLYLSYAGGIEAVNEQETTTGPGWTSILTGVWADKHGVINKYSTRKNADTFLTEQAAAGHRCFFGCNWEPLFSTVFRNDIIESIRKRLPVEYYNPAFDSGLFFRTMEILQTCNEDNDYDLICVDFTGIDKAGHSYGFDDNEHYRSALQIVDSYTVDLLDSIKHRKTFDKEDWLIILTTDHGGRLRNHGEQTPLERITWTAVNKKIEITDELINYVKQDR